MKNVRKSCSKTVNLKRILAPKETTILGLLTY